MYTHDAAKKLGCSEAELVALGCNEKAHRLTIVDMPLFLNELMQFGTVMFLVRNEAAVLEMDGQLAFSDKVKFIAGQAEGLSLSLTANCWSSVFAVYSSEWMKRGIQIFNVSGDAVLKIYIRDNACTDDFDSWLRPWVSIDQSQAQSVAARVVETCSYGGLVEGKAVAAPSNSHRTLLAAAAASGESVRLSVCNSGCRWEVRTVVKTLKEMGPWYNILDDALHLHLREELVKSATRMPSQHHAGEMLISLHDAKETPVLRLGVNATGDAAKSILA